MILAKMERCKTRDNGVKACLRTAYAFCNNESVTNLQAQTD